MAAFSGGKPVFSAQAIGSGRSVTIGQGYYRLTNTSTRPFCPLASDVMALPIVAP
jgi:hypothetical protein